MARPKKRPAPSLEAMLSELKTLDEIREDEDYKRTEEAKKAYVNRFNIYEGDPARFIREQVDRKLIDWQVKEIELAAKRPIYCLSCPRQNGKSEVLLQSYLYYMFVMGRRVSHSAHRLSTSNGLYEKLANTISANPQLQEMVKRQIASGGAQWIELENGGSIRFSSRTRSQGLGMTYDVVGIDEGQDLTTEQYNTISHTLKTAEEPIVLICGTPPTPNSVGDHWVSLHKKHPEYFSVYGVDSYASDIENKDHWYKANPSLGILFEESTIAREVQTVVDVLDFNIQTLGLWLSDEAKSAFKMDMYDAKELTPESASRRYDLKKYYVGIKSDIDGTQVSVVVAWRNPEGEYLIQGVDTRPMNRGLAWVAEWMESKAGIVKVWADGVIRTKLAQEYPDLVHAVMPQEFGASTFELQSAYDTGRLYHFNQPALQSAFQNAQKRPYGTKGDFGYKKIIDQLSINQVEAAALAIGCASSRSKYDDDDSPGINF